MKDLWNNFFSNSVDVSDYHLRPGVRGKKLEVNDGYQQLMFSVKARRSAHLTLWSDGTGNEPYFDVYIGGGGNTKSAIRINASEAETYGRIDSEELRFDMYKTFWMSWNTHSSGNFSIQVGRGHLGHDVFIHEYFDTWSTYMVSYIEIWSHEAKSEWVISQGWYLISSYLSNMNDTLQFRYKSALFKFGHWLWNKTNSKTWV